MTTLRRLTFFLLLAALVTGILFAANAVVGTDTQVSHERRTGMAAGLPGADSNAATRQGRGEFHQHDENDGLAGFVSTLAPIALVILVVTQTTRLFGLLRRRKHPVATS